jgi:hypothetical protein
VIVVSRASKSWTTNPAADFADLVPLASLLEITKAREAMRAEASVDRYAFATIMLELAMIESGTNKAIVIPMNSTITFPLSSENLVIRLPRR